MQESPYSIVFRTPELLAIFGALILLEIVWAKYIRKQEYGTGEALASLGIAAGRAVAKMAMGLVMAGVYLFVYDLRLLDLQMTDWKMWAILFLAGDFIYYWMHRFKHEIRWMWADHAVHHSGNYLNFFMNYRLGWTGLIAGTWLMYLPLVFIGFPPVAVVTMFALSLVWQFWIHTDMIGKLGPLEWVLNTPSHHRVHHSRNPVYLDKNYAGILIIWDRIFGTFQEELDEERCDYGLVKPLKTVNPIRIAFHEWINLFHDVRAATTWKGRFHAAFGYPGDKQEVVATQKALKEEREARKRQQEEEASAGAAPPPATAPLAEDTKQT